MKKKQLNLTSGPILRTLSELALPIMASSFLSTAYNITDMAWIGMLWALKQWLVWAWEVCTSGSPRDFLPWQEWEDR